MQEMKGKLTIIMIAHRLGTIRSAENIIYLENPSNQLCAEKGSVEYSEIMERL